MGIDNAYTGRFPFLFVIKDGVHHREGPKRKVARLFSPGDGRRIAIIISAERAASLAQVPFLTLPPALLQMQRCRLGEMGAPPINDRTVLIVPPDEIRKIGFHTG